METSARKVLFLTAVALSVVWGVGMISFALPVVAWLMMMFLPSRATLQKLREARVAGALPEGERR